MAEHIHGDGCDCGCNHEEDDELIITLELDDGTELECTVITIIEVEGRDYIAVLPTSGPQFEEGEVFLYRYSETEDEEPVIDNIETDDEWEAVSDAFDEWLDSAEFDELVDEE